MGLPRSTYYDAPPVKTDDAEIVANITAICDEFEAYGYRRVGAELRHRGMVVNSKKIRRLMREHDLQPKRRRRFVATTDSDHDNPIFPDLARDRIVDGPNQLWVYTDPSWIPQQTCAAISLDCAIHSGRLPAKSDGRGDHDALWGRTSHSWHNEPNSIGRFVPYGCIRMFNEDIADLYRRVAIGTPVIVE